MPKKFLSVKQVAKILGVTPLTVRNWDKKNKLNAYRNPINNYRMYRIEDVENLLKQIDESRNSQINETTTDAKEKKIEVEML